MMLRKQIIKQICLCDRPTDEEKWLSDLAGVCVLDIRFSPASNISHQHLFHSCHQHYVCVGVGHWEDGLHWQYWKSRLRSLGLWNAEWRTVFLLGLFTSLYLIWKTKPVVQVQAEVTVSWLLLGRRAEAILLTYGPDHRTARPVAAASDHLTHRLVVEVYVEVRRHLPPFSHIQQSQWYEEGLDLVQEIQLSQFLYIYFGFTLQKSSFH